MTNLEQNKTTIINLETDGEYWIKQEDFYDNFRQAPLSNSVVIHLQDNWMSLTQAMVVPVIEKLIEEVGRDSSTVYIDSPNEFHSDTPWVTLNSEKNEIVKSIPDWSLQRRLINGDCKTWAFFAEQKTTASLLALYNICQDANLKQQCLLKVTDDRPTFWPFDVPYMTYDRLDDWLPVSNKVQRILAHHNFREFCYQPGVDTIKDSSTKHLVEIGDQYLFEIVFEPVTRGVAFSLSKKAIRSIVTEKPSVVYAPKNFLKNLNDIGFKTFSDLWDESYDQLEGQERLAAMLTLVTKISNMPRTEQLELYAKSRAICQYNRKVLKTQNSKK